MNEKRKGLWAYGALLLAIVASLVLGVSFPRPPGPDAIEAQVIKDTQFRSVHIEHDLDVDGDVDVDGTVYFDDLDVDGAVTLNSTLDVDGATTLNSTLDVDGNVSSGTGAFTITDALSVTNWVALESTLWVDGATEITGTVDLNSTLDTDGKVTIAADGLEVTGAGDFNTSLNSDGAVTFNTTLDVDGNVTSGTGSFTVADDINVTGAADFDSTVGTDGKLTVTAGGLEVTGAADFNTSLNSDGAAVLQTTLDVYGNVSSSTGAVTVSDALSVTGWAAFESTLWVDGNTEVTGTVDFNSTLDVDDKVTISSGGFESTGGGDFNTSLNVDGATTVDSLDVDNGRITLQSDETIGNATNDQIDFGIAAAPAFSMTAASLFLNEKSIVFDDDMDSWIVSTVDDQITVTLGAAAGIFGIGTGNFQVGSGVPDVALDGDDAYIVGALEIDGAVTLDSTFDVDGATTLNSTLDVDGNVTSGTGAFTITDNVVISSVADIVQLLIRGQPTQTFSIMVVEDSGGTDILSITPAQDAGVSGNLFALLDIFAAMDGSDSLVGVAITLTGGESTGTGNALTAISLTLTTPDAQVTEVALDVNDGDWDYAIEAGDVPIVSTAATWMEDFFGDTLRGELVNLEGTDPQIVALALVTGAQFGEATLVSGDDPAGCAESCCEVTLGTHWRAGQGSLIFETRLHLDTTIAETHICAGLTDLVTLEMPAQIAAASIGITATDALVFCFDTNATTDQWYAIGVDTGTPATGNAITGVAPTADTYQVLRIEVEAAGNDARFYIDGALVGTLTANAVAPAAPLTPVIVIDTVDANESTVDIDYIFVSAQR